MSDVTLLLYRVPDSVTAVASNFCPLTLVAEYIVPLIQIAFISLLKAMLKVDVDCLYVTTSPKMPLEKGIRLPSAPRKP